MKKILFLTLMLALCANTVFAAQDIPPGYPPALDGISGMEGGKTAPEIDYISPKVVPLTPKEKRLSACRMIGRDRMLIRFSLAAARSFMSTGRASPRLWQRPCKFRMWSLRPEKS